MIWMQWAAAVLGLGISLWTLLDAVLAYRLVRRLGVDSVYRLLSKGTLFDELGRVGLHLCIVTATTALVIRGITPRLSGAVILFLTMTTLLVLSSVNNLVTRRKVLGAVHRPGWRS